MHRYAVRLFAIADVRQAAELVKLSAEALPDVGRLTAELPLYATCQRFPGFGASDPTRKTWGLTATTHLVADIVHGVALYTLTAEALVVDAIVVDPIYRRQRVAAELVGTLKSEARAAQLPIACALWERNDVGIAFLASRGFVAQGLIAKPYADVPSGVAIDDDAIEFVYPLTLREALP